MILSDIKQYLQANKRVTLGDLAHHFHSSPLAMKGMLQQWVNKGKVVRHDGLAMCMTTCGKCDDDVAMEIYEWVA